MPKTKRINGPVNPPGTPRVEQKCSFCLISLGGFREENRSEVSKDPDLIAANLYQWCTKCREKLKGRNPDSHYLKPNVKWRAIVYQMFWNSKNPDGFWEFVKSRNPFGKTPFDPETELCEE